MIKKDQCWRWRCTVTIIIANTAVATALHHKGFIVMVVTPLRVVPGTGSLQRQSTDRHWLLSAWHPEDLWKKTKQNMHSGQVGSATWWMQLKQTTVTKVMMGSWCRSAKHPIPRFGSLRSWHWCPVSLLTYFGWQFYLSILVTSIKYYLIDETVHQ